MEQEDFTVVYEDNHLIIVNKASGVLVQGDKTGDESLVEMVRQYIREKYNKPGNVFCAPVHRLDRPVSGLVIFARTSKGAERMAKVFQEHKITKTYWAQVSERPEKEEDRLVNFLQKDNITNTVKAFLRPKRGAQRAELDYKIKSVIGGHYLLEVQPITGRPHQIRVQLAKMGCPILGDVKYGYPKAQKTGAICLHAHRLEFMHPIKQEQIVVEAPLPYTRHWQRFVDGV